MAEKAILYDATKCTACRGCQAACKQWNERKGEATVNTGSYENPPDLSVNTWLKMEFRELGNNGTVRWLFNRRSCMHCTEAACVDVCPTGALYHHPYGFVSLDKELCTGCGYCLEFCPFHVPRQDGSAATGLGKLMDKCTFCTTPGLDRISIDQEPACVKTCPPDALIYDNRSQLLEIGKKRVASLQKQGYTNAYLYGEKEVGGTHVLYVLDDSPEVYGLPRDPKVPATTVLWQRIIQPLGLGVMGLTALGLMLNLLVSKAAKAEEEKEA